MNGQLLTPVILVDTPLRLAIRQFTPDAFVRINSRYADADVRCRIVYGLRRDCHA